MAQDLSSDDGTETSTGNAVEVARPSQVISDDALTGIKSYEDAWAAAEAAGGAVEDWSDYGTGFVVVANKDELVDKPFVIAEWRFNDGKFADQFVSMAVVTKDNRKLIVNDGGTGIRDQLMRVTAKRLERGAPEGTARVGLVCERGLRKSTYPFTDDQGKEQTGTTYYLG
jgi:hypothetical protein